MSEPVSPQPAASSALRLTPAPPRRRRWVTVLLFLVTFACGGIVGVGGTLKVIDNRVQEAIHHPERMPVRVADRLKWRLGLSDQQRAQTLEIIERRQRDLLAIRRRVQPEVERVLDNIEKEVADILNASQREKWLSDVHRLRERFTPPMPMPANEDGDRSKPKGK